MEPTKQICIYSYFFDKCLDDWHGEKEELCLLRHVNLQGYVPAKETEQGEREWRMTRNV